MQGSEEWHGDQQRAAGLEHPMHFRQQAFRIRTMLKHFGAESAVDRGIGQGDGAVVPYQIRWSVLAALASTIEPQKFANSERRSGLPKDLLMPLLGRS